VGEEASGVVAQSKELDLIMDLPSVSMAMREMGLGLAMGACWWLMDRCGVLLLLKIVVRREGAAAAMFWMELAKDLHRPPCLSFPNTSSQRGSTIVLYLIDKRDERAGGGRKFRGGSIKGFLFSCPWLLSCAQFSPAP
jgi:hypothetical protein